ncbi:MAG: DUF2950 domain-containing protein [Candidatus Sulfotelmatobacter sp.]|jgi:hypothetical protein
MKSVRSNFLSYPSRLNHAIAFTALAAFGLVFSSSPATAQSKAEPTASTSQMSMAQKSTAPQPGQETFSSAAHACHALIAGLEKDDQASLLKILGPDAKDIISSGDPAEDKDNRQQFVQKYRQMHRLVTEPDGTTTLYIGAENWPTPIPLIHQASAWYFDTPTGKKEILYRRIGKNELAVIQTCNELVAAEKEYYAKPHDGAPEGEYAQKFFSDSGKQNGLYWETSSANAASPIGPLVAVAAVENYPQPPDRNLEPFQGYYFRILKAQGKKASGGAHSYIKDGKMAAGFAFVAYPAEYRNSGVMTFLVNQDGVVYQKDLGPKTAEIAKTIKSYDPDSSWHKAD